MKKFLFMIPMFFIFCGAYQPQTLVETGGEDYSFSISYVLRLARDAENHRKSFAFIDSSNNMKIFQIDYIPYNAGLLQNYSFYFPKGGKVGYKLSQYQFDGNTYPCFYSYLLRFSDLDLFANNYIFSSMDLFSSRFTDTGSLYYPLISPDINQFMPKFVQYKNLIYKVKHLRSYDAIEWFIKSNLPYDSLFWFSSIEGIKWTNYTQHGHPKSLSTLSFDEIFSYVNDVFLAFPEIMSDNASSKIAYPLGFAIDNDRYFCGSGFIPGDTHIKCPDDKGDYTVQEFCKSIGNPNGWVSFYQLNFLIRYFYIMLYDLTPVKGFYSINTVDKLSDTENTTLLYLDKTGAYYGNIYPADRLSWIVEFFSYYDTDYFHTISNTPFIDSLFYDLNNTLNLYANKYVFYGRDVPEPIILNYTASPSTSSNSNTSNSGDNKGSNIDYTKIREIVVDSLSDVSTKMDVASINDNISSLWGDLASGIQSINDNLTGFGGDNSSANSWLLGDIRAALTDTGNLGKTPLPLFDDKIEEIEKKDIISLFDNINLPFSPVLRSAKLNVTNLQSSFAFDFNGRSIVFDFADFDKELTYFGSMVYIFLVFSSVLYVFRNEG